MSLQTIIDTAQTIEISRQALVASSISRNGKMLTANRSWVKPWSFTVVPRPIWLFADFRGSIEDIFNNDRYKEQLIHLGADNTAWLVAYQGALTNVNLNNITVIATLGNTITFSCSDGLAAGTVLFRAGDIVQFAGLGSDSRGYRYPYVVKYDLIVPGTLGDIITSTPFTLNVNRGMILQANFDPIGKPLRVGTACTWTVKVTKLPTMRYLPGKFVEFNGEFQMMESVV
jgi:hypothetical protein